MKLFRRIKNFLFTVEKRESTCEIVSAIARFNIGPNEPFYIKDMDFDPDIFGQIDIFSISTRTLHSEGVFGESKVLSRNLGLTPEYSTDLADMRLILSGEAEDERECLSIVNKLIKPTI